MERNASKSASHWTVWNYPQISTLEPSYAQLILDIYIYIGYIPKFQSFIELDDGKIYRKTLSLMVKTMVSG
jgi:hypothetical protein